MIPDSLQWWIVIKDHNLGPMENNLLINISTQYSLCTSLTVTLELFQQHIISNSDSWISNGMYQFMPCLEEITVLGNNHSQHRVLYIILKFPDIRPKVVTVGLAFFGIC